MQADGKIWVVDRRLDTNWNQIVSFPVEADRKLLRNAFNSVCNYRKTLAEHSMSVWQMQCQIGEQKQMVIRKIESIDKQKKIIGQHRSSTIVAKNESRAEKSLKEQKMSLWEQQKNLDAERLAIEMRRKTIERQVNELHEHVQDMGDYRKIKF